MSRQNKSNQGHEPLYRFVKATSGDASAPTPPYTPYSSETSGRREPSQEDTGIVTKTLPPTKKAESEGSIQQVLMPTLLLLSGAIFFLFGLVLILCSRDGIFVLRWNAGLWPFYFFPSPVIFGMAYGQ